MNIVLRYAGFVLATFVLYVLVVGVVVTSGMLLARVLGRSDPMDESQARVFGAFRPSFGARVLGQLVEVAAASFDIFLRALWLLRLLPRVPDAGSGTPIVLLPGYTENAGAMWWLARRLAKRGFRPILIDFPSTFASIDSNVRFLRDELTRIQAYTGGARVAIVAHSMGGVIARALVLSEPQHAVLTVIALSSPFRGTHLARIGALLGLGESVIDMTPNSPFAHRFLPSAAPQVPIRCIIGEQENVVAPPWSSVLPTHDEVHLMSLPVGHDAPLVLRESFDCVERWLVQSGVLRANGLARAETEPQVSIAELSVRARSQRLRKHAAHDLEQDQRDDR